MYLYGDNFNLEHLNDFIIEGYNYFIFCMKITYYLSKFKSFFNAFLIEIM